MFTIALVNQKGGVGKSTTAVNLSAGLARLGKRVLLIDLDPQAHSTVALGLQPKTLPATVYSLLAGSVRLDEVIKPVAEGLSVLPSTIELAAGEAELATQPDPAFVLKRAMAALDPAQFDYAIVDSPPQLGFLNVNSLAWVKEVYIPVTCEFYALHGLSLLMETVDRIRERINPDLRISGVIPCQYNARRGLTRDVLADLDKHFPGRVTKTKIRVNVRLAEAPGHGKSIFDYAPESNGATDYLNLAKEFVERAAAAPLPELPVAVPETVVAAPEPVIETPEPVVAAAEPVVVAPEPAVEAPEPVVAVAESVAAEPELMFPAMESSGHDPLAEVLASSDEAPAPIVVEAAPEPEFPVAAVEAAAPAPEPEPEPMPEPVAEPVAEAPAEPQPSEFVSPYPATPVSALRADITPVPLPAEPAKPPMAGRFAMAGLKPIVVARPGQPPPPKPKSSFGQKLFGMFGKKD